MLTGPNTNDVSQLGHEQFAVTDLIGTGVFENCRDRRFELLVGYHDFDLDFRHEIDGLFRATIPFGMAFLSAKSTDLRDRHTLNAQGGQSLFNGVQLKVPNDCFDFLHCL